jgi:glycine cleavage system H protein
MPVAGTITEINPSLESQPEVVNKDPYGEGWMVKMTVANVGDVNNLLSADDYKKVIS